MRLFLFGLTLVALIASAGPASAHAFLKSALPPVGSTVRQAPARLVIAFTENVEPLFSTVTVKDAAGTDMSAGKLSAGSDAAHLELPLQSLKPGTYKVIWHATSTDTHKTKGDFTFSVAP